MPLRRPNYRLGAAPEFQQDYAGRPLPDTLYSGPPPYTGRREGKDVVESGAGAPGMPGAPNAAMPGENRLPEPWDSLLRGVQRKGNFTAQYGAVGQEPVLVRVLEDRLYLIIQNTTLANTLFVGVGYPPTTTTGVLLAANGGAYEPSVIPQQEIWLLGSAANTTFVILYANG